MRMARMDGCVRKGGRSIVGICSAVLTADCSAIVQMHHILYEDGENEWVCLPEEAHAWSPSLPSAAYPAGLAPGEQCTP